MSIPEIESRNDAMRYSDLCEAGERDEEEQYRKGMQINKVCQAIRDCDLDGDGVRQILATLASRMVATGFAESSIEMIDTASECVD